MKKTYILTIVALLFSFAAQAQGQISQGTLFLGGSLGFSSSSTDNKVGNTETRTFESSSISVAPSVGYFVADKTAVGVRFGFTNSKTTFIAGNNDKTVNTRTPINVGIFAERYFMMIPEFGFTAGIFGDFLTGSSKREVIDGTTGVAVVTENNISGFNTGLNAGTIWFPNPHIGFSANVGLLSFTTETTTVKNANPEISTKESGFNFDLSSVNLNFGFHYYFYH
jgi:hypothetical protein